MSISSIVKKVRGIFKRKDIAKEALESINENRGLLWEKIAIFKEQVLDIEGAVRHHTEEMDDLFPTKHHLKNGMYTREVFMPKGSLVVSFIHKQDHPSFFLEGEMSILMDTGEVKRIKAPMQFQTETGTQRVAYMHEDCRWTCVYRTDAKEIAVAEKEVYTEDFLELPEHVILNKRCLE